MSTAIQGLASRISCSSGAPARTFSLRRKTPKTRDEGETDGAAGFFAVGEGFARGAKGDFRHVQQLGDAADIQKPPFRIALAP